MNTYKGRVVYERIQHKMTEKDATRILRSINQEKSPAELARALWGIDMEIVKLQVLTDDDVYEFFAEFLSLILDFIGAGLGWVRDLLMGLWGSPPEGVNEELPEEPVEEEEE